MHVFPLLICQALGNISTSANLKRAASAFGKMPDGKSQTVHYSPLLWR